MKTLGKQSVFVLVAVLACMNLHAQTADEIVSKYVSAIGGKAAIEGVKTLYVESDVDFAGNDAPMKTWIINGKGFKTESEFGGAKMQQCVSDKGGWMVNPMMGTSAQAMPDQQVKALKGQINIGGPLYDYATKGNKIELIGQDDADYKIKLTTPTAISSTFYVNKKTYYIDKAVSKVSAQGQEFETTISFSDYRKLDGGYVFYFGQEVVSPMATVKITNKKVEVNSQIDPTIFDMPK
jgi:hypothetical protein